MSGEVKFVCPDCAGDGKETCHNPDHGFIAAMGGEIGRLGCPCCGHDPAGKVRNGGNCETCAGTGVVALSVARDFLVGFDFEDIMSRVDDDFYQKLEAAE